MKRSGLFLLFFSLVVSFSFICPKPTFAQVNVEELQQYLTSIYWTTEELEEYLKHFDTSIDQFDSIDQLINYLGTPINNENLNALLGRYNLDHSDLELLLAEYGESLDDYRFIEDLDLDVQFYLRHHEEFKIVNDFLSLFGLSEDEMKNLFNHFTLLDEDRLTEKLDQIYEQINSLSYLRGEDKLDEEGQRKIFSLWSELLSALRIEGEFYLVNDEEMEKIQLTELAALLGDERFGHSLRMILYNENREILATLSFSEDMLTSYLMYESLEQLSEISQLADQYRLLVDVIKLPRTAGNYLLNIFISVVFIIGGIWMLALVRRRVEV